MNTKDEKALGPFRIFGKNGKEKPGIPMRRACLLLALCAGTLAACKEKDTVRKTPGKVESTENTSSVSEEEAMSMAAALDALESKDAASVAAENTNPSSESKIAGSSNAPETVKETDEQGRAYPIDDYPYNPKEDRGKYSLEKPDIVVGDKFYATQINDWYKNFQDYEGKTVSIEGMYMNFGGYTLVGRNGPSCPYCTGGYVNFEFKTDLDLSGLESEKSWIRVKGVLRQGKYSISKDVSQLIYYIEALEVEKMDKPGVNPITD
ncbi:hypothetical protein [Oribacterium sinus]